jgi:mannose-6-phosphate isomerase-like protein (cupin superfamily)
MKKGFTLMLETHKKSGALQLPGSTIGVKVKVYDTPSPDGQISGTPHVHLLCTEMYFVLQGSGAVELIDKNGFSTVELLPHSTLIFSPGTIHRLINPNQNLELLVIEQSGLPEYGDNIVCFTNEWLESDSRFAEAMRVKSLEDAYLRRARGVEGFLQLKTAFSESLSVGQEALGRFYQLALQRTSHLHSKWKNVITDGALAEAQNALGNVISLNSGDISHLFESQQYLIQTAEYSKLGCCGHLSRMSDNSTLMPEGLSY